VQPIRLINLESGLNLEIIISEVKIAKEKAIASEAATQPAS